MMSLGCHMVYTLNAACHHRNDLNVTALHVTVPLELLTPPRVMAIISLLLIAASIVSAPLVNTVVPLPRPS